MDNSIRGHRNSVPLDLPRSRDVLVVLLEESQRFIDTFDKLIRLQRLRRDTLSHIQADPLYAARQRHALIKAAGKEGLTLWAQGLPSIHSLVPHLDQSRFDCLLRHREGASKQLCRTPASRASFNLADWINRLDAVVTLDGEILALFIDLRRRIALALEGCADARADSMRKLVRILPKNPHILALYHEIEFHQDSSKSQNEIARDFVARYGGKDTSLLRGVRRFRQRLEQMD